MLKGNLSEFPLGTLIQTLAAAGRSGSLLISPPWLSGRVVLLEGSLYAAFAGEKSGWQAMELLAGLREAPFAFDADRPPPVEGNVNLPLETALARLLAVMERWDRFRQIPSDWSLGVHLARKSGELKLTPAMLQVLGLAEGNSIAEVLAQASTAPVDTAAALDELLAGGILQLSTPAGMEEAELVALSLYGKQTGVAFIDEALFEEWRRLLARPFQLKVRSPRGIEAQFEAQPRSEIAGRIMLNDRDLRRLRAGRGIKLLVKPELKGADE